MSHSLLTPDSRARTQVQPQGRSFVGLVGVELRRLWWRRLTKAVILGIVAFTAIAVYNAYNQSTPEILAQRLDSYELMLKDFEEQRANVPQMVAECKAQEVIERERVGDDSISFGCDQMAADMGRTPSLEDFGISLPVADTITASLASSSAFVYAFLVLILMGSFVAAEFSTGSMGNWLTFKPRRIHVALSKLAAAALGGALLAALGLALLTVGARMVATINRPDAALNLPTPPPLDGSVPELLLRAVGVVVAAGLAGAALGLLLRHTAALFGLLFGYMVVVEGIVVNAFLGGRLTPWAVTPNATAFLEKGYEYQAETCSTVSGDFMCTYASHQISYTHGWVYLLVLGLVLSAAAVVSFRHRDVT